MALAARPGGRNWALRGDRGELMEAVGASEPAGAPTSKIEKEGSKSLSRRRWRKAKAKGERARRSPEGPLHILRGTED